MPASVGWTNFGDKDKERKTELQEKQKVFLESIPKEELLGKTKPPQQANENQQQERTRI